MRMLDTSEWTDEVITKTIDAAETLQSRFNNAHMVSIGQSPAWMLFALGQMRQKNGAEAEAHITYLPFSGRFTEIDTDQVTLTYNATEEAPDTTALSTYFNVMADHGVTASAILDRYDQNEQKTVFTDYALYGEGLASFIYVYFSAMRHLCGDDEDTMAQLAQATLFHVLAGHDSVLKHDTHLVVQSTSQSYDDIPYSRDYFGEEKFILTLAGQRGEESGHMGSDRLVASYNIAKNGRQKLLPPHNEARQKIIKAKFVNVIDRKISAANRRKENLSLKAQ